jgi:hypothetical protein
MSNETLFDLARMPALDDMGYAFHPDIDQFMHSESNDPANDEEAYLDAKRLSEAGFEDHFVGFDGDCRDKAIRDRYFEGGDGPIGWEPSKPDGDGWLLVAIYDTENGPYAMFVRRVGRA